MMLEGAGFEVIDLGINTDVDKFLAALELHQPDILGMSALLTTTMPYMKVVVDTLIEKGLREKYLVLVGGAPLNEEFGHAVGADAYCRDAAVAAETAKALVKTRPRPVEGRAARPVGDLKLRTRHDRRAPCHRLWSPRLRAARRAERPKVWPTLVEVTYLPANLHNRPERIVPELEPLLDQAVRARSQRVHRLRRLRNRWRARCPARTAPRGDPPTGSHCYEFFSGADQFAAMHEEELGTFFLTDFLAKHFDALAVARAGSRSPPAVARHVLRQLQAGRVDLADQQPGDRDDGSCRGRTTRSGVRTPPRRARTVHRGGRARRRDLAVQAGGVMARARPLEPRARSSSTGATSPRRSTPKKGRDRHQVVLGGKFQRAIDRRQAQGQDLHGRRRGCPVAPRKPADHRRPRRRGAGRCRRHRARSTATNASDCSPTTAAGRPTW